MSLSMQRRSPIRHVSSDRSDSPVRRRSPPRMRSPSRRERSPERHRSSPRKRSPVRTISSHRRKSPTREKSTRCRSPKHGRSVSPVLRSPSPHTKRLKRVQAEREADRVTDRERERNNVRESDKGRHRERGVDREAPSNRERGVDKEAPSDRERGVDKEIPSKRTERSDRSERRSARDRDDNGSSRSRHGHSTSPTDRGHRHRHSSRSPPGAGARHEVAYPRGSEQSWDDDKDSVAKMKATEEALEEKQKQKPSFELSGKLAAETNRVRGVTLLFNEPPDARKPNIRWRLYVFKGGEVLNDPLYVHRQSCYLFGRERRVADIPTDHPSCSKQHAIIQFRQVEKEETDGTLTKQVRPYLMDLGSTNGTFINDNRIEPQRYYELIEKDTIKFGNSSREYVILHENSAE
ncbi:FHA domain-containing protein DDL isoform X2 [Macadamia integrifolia]|uniref:FHA domain-containing protein DDL isoform X2 n=1 Tax=Macadamia integrifolia TaxID=60698 RepID=UPI001C4F661D|nr:FHA domain-containing protein DDL isoform X2 [Macadamia integrifolia]